MSKQAAVGALIVLALAAALALRPARLPAYSTDSAQVARIAQALLPQAHPPVGFAGTVGVAGKYAVFAPPGQNTTLLLVTKAPPGKLEEGPVQSRTPFQVSLKGRAYVGERQELPGLTRYVLAYGGVTLVTQGPRDDFPERAWAAFLQGL